jgi:hypothetical protein
MLTTPEQDVRSTESAPIHVPSGDRSRPSGQQPRSARSQPAAPAGAAQATGISADTADGPGPTSGGLDDSLDLAATPSEWLGNEVVTLARHLATDTYALLRLIGEIDARDAYVLWGALSCAAWLADACEIELSTAHRQVRVARAMRRWAVLDAAMADGDVSFAKARTIAPHLSDDNVDALVDLARSTPVGHLGSAVAAWLHRHDDPDEIARRQHRERSVSWRTDPDGLVTITARLEPADAGAVCAVIDTQVMRAPMGAASEVEDDDSRPSLAQQRADALVAVVTAPPANRAHGRGASEADGPGTGTDDAGIDGPTSRVDTELLIHVTADGNHLCDGTPLGDHAVIKLLPDAFVSLLMHDAARQPIDASPRRRFPTRRQRKVVDARHDRCAEPGCNATKFLEYDHIQSYDPRHPNTVLANLQRLCGPHNRAKYDRAGQHRDVPPPEMVI